jgi:hypothetical protein
VDSGAFRIAAAAEQASGQGRMTNVESRMTKEGRIPKDESARRALLALLPHGTMDTRNINISDANEHSFSELASISVD